MIRASLSALAMSAAIAAGDAASADVRYRLLVKTGDAVPGVPGRMFDAGPANPSGSCTINDQGKFAALVYSDTGRLLVAGGVRGTGGTNLRVVLAPNRAITGFPAGSVVSLIGQRLGLSPDGRVVGGAALAGAGIDSSNSYIFYAETQIGSPPIILARQGSPVPALPGVAFGNINALESQPSVGGGAGAVFAFAAPMQGTGISSLNDGAIWRGRIDDPGAMAMLAREGEAIPGQPAGAFYRELAFAAPIVGPSGEVALIGTALIGGTTAPTLMVFREDSSAPVIVARQGATLAGFTITGFPPNGLVLGGGSMIALSVAVASTVSGARAALVGPWDNLGLVRAVGAGGTVAQGLGPPALSHVGPQAYTLGFDGRIAWISTLTGTGVNTANDLCWYAEGDSAEAPLVRESAATPMLPANQTFSGFGSGALHGRDARGRLVTLANIQGSGVGASNNAAIITTDAALSPRVSWRLGTPVLLGPSDTRTPSAINANGSSVTPVMTSRGEFIFTAHFTSNTRAIVLGEIDPCLADFDRSGEATLQDLLDFLQAWFALAPAADLDRAGGVALQDLFDFLVLWFAGCG